MKTLYELLRHLREAVLDDRARQRIQLLCVFAALTAIAGVMTVLNIVTQKGLLTSVTLLFTVLCGSILLLLKLRRIQQSFSEAVFIAVVYALFLYFIVSGNPDGFSVLWVSLLPCCGLLLFGRRRGGLACLGMLLALLFFFYVPAGRALLQYEYSETFLQRFPLLYTAFFLIGYLLEMIRAFTYDALKKARTDYQYQSCHDALTGVYNRQGFNEIMDGLLAERSAGLLTLILDLDEFKSVNDRYGHLQGDEVLIRVAKVIEEAVGESGQVCRWGGEEFAVLIPAPEDARGFAEALRTAIGSLVVPTDAGPISVTASIGAVTSVDGTASARQIVTRADQCLYEAKSGGRNRVVFDAV